MAEELLPLVREQLALEAGGESVAPIGKVDRVRIAGEGWSLDVRDDGNTIRFRNESASGTSAIESKPNDTQIEEAARGLVQRSLGSVLAPRFTGRSKATLAGELARIGASLSRPEGVREGRGLT